MTMPVTGGTKKGFRTSRTRKPETPAWYSSAEHLAGRRSRDDRRPEPDDLGRSVRVGGGPPLCGSYALLRTTGRSARVAGGRPAGEPTGRPCRRGGSRAP